MTLELRHRLRSPKEKFVAAVIFCMFAAAPAVARDAVSVTLQTDLETRSASAMHLQDRANVLRFYKARDFHAAWVGNPDAGFALAAMRGAAADGLDPAQYASPLFGSHPNRKDSDEAAVYDLTLTDRLLLYARDLRTGRIAPNEADRMVGLPRPDFDAAATLETALHSHRLKAWPADLAPAHPEYKVLKAGLARYRALAAKGGWPAVPDMRKIELVPGNPAVAILEKRLAAQYPGFKLPADIPALEAAVRRFQAENGLAVDGVVGRQTIGALNTPASERVAQISANMERWRWVPHSFPARYIAVNAADATLKAVENGKTILTSRVIVGKRKTPTAIFDARAIALTVNPYWTVPKSIVRNEIMPKVRRNPSYLAKHHMIVDNGQIRQLPGDDNALGYLKVEMPNAFSAYLHDTSARALFANDERHLSHGCIRVQNIRPLAAWLLTGDAQKGQARVDAAIETGTTQKIALDKQVPVFVLYWTAVAQDDGTVGFRPDIYGRDERLIAALGLRPETRAAWLGERIESCKS